MARVWIFRTLILFNAVSLGWAVWGGSLFTISTVAQLATMAGLIFCHQKQSIQMKEFLQIVGYAEKQENAFSFLKRHLQSNKVFVEEMKYVVANINEIGHQKFSDLVANIKDADARELLLAANEKIIALRKKENQANWITQGAAEFAELKIKGSDVAEYCFKAVSAMVNYLKANQGGFYLLKKDGSEEWFELTASYAYFKKKYVERRINPGDGLIGQVYYEKEIIYLTDVPKDYIRITSGLGEALPRCICIVPLLSEGKILGAIELASFKKFEPFEMEYLKKIAEGIAYNLYSIENQRHTEKLLQESQKMAQEVRSQEEELRQNMEELTATQEQMRRKQGEIDAVMASLSTVELDLEGRVIQANPIFLGITGYTSNDIQGKLYKLLIPQHGNDPVQYEIMWSSILSGRSFSGEFRIVNKQGKEMWMAGNFTPINNEDGRPYKVMVISLFTTQDKEKLFELQEMVTALKCCFPLAELNQDLTFKSANDLFLSELGIRRIDLKKSLPKTIFEKDSYQRMEKYFSNSQSDPDNIELEIQNKLGEIKRFNSTIINVVSEYRKKGLLILKNEVEEWKQVS